MEIHIITKHKFIFHADNMELIYYIIHTLLSLLKPLVWNYPIITTPPYDHSQLLTLLSATFPMIIGISSTKILSNKLCKQYPDLIIIDLNKYIVYQSKNIRSFYKLPSLLYEKLSNQLNKTIEQRNFNELSTVHQSLLSYIKLFILSKFDIQFKKIL